MQHQMDFWPAARNALYEQPIWDSLSTEEQAEIIAQLARMIAQTVCPPSVEQTQEGNHEQ